MSKPFAPVFLSLIAHLKSFLKNTTTTCFHKIKKEKNYTFTKLHRNLFHSLKVMIKAIIKQLINHPKYIIKLYKKNIYFVFKLFFQINNYFILYQNFFLKQTNMSDKAFICNMFPIFGLKKILK